MRFNNWKLNELIEWLQNIKSSPDFDCYCVTRCFGEIRIYNGEGKSGEATFDFLDEPPEPPEEEVVGNLTNERKYIAISIKHTGEKWKPGKPCVLWGYKRTRDNEKRCFGGYTERLENAELYAVDDMYNHGYAEDIIKREPVKMCADLCRKYGQYDTVLMLESDYQKYCEVFGLVGDES